MSALLELAERCEAATGPDRELDAQIGAAFHLKMLTYRADNWITNPPFTAFLDAAMTLVPEGAKVTTQSFGGPGPMALVDPNERFTSAATLALALCAAALRAQAADEPTP